MMRTDVRWASCCIFFVLSLQVSLLSQQASVVGRSLCHKITIAHGGKMIYKYCERLNPNSPPRGSGHPAVQMECFQMPTSKGGVEENSILNVFPILLADYFKCLSITFS